MAATDPPALIYLEADDEVTAVVRRLRATDGRRVIVVAPGRSRATSSVVALRLLARVAADDGRELAVVGDALTRSLASEAGVRSYTSVDDARAARARPPKAAAGERTDAQRAGIHVVRGRDADDTAPTLAAAPLAEELASAETVVLERVPSGSAPGPRALTARRSVLSRLGLPVAATIAALALVTTAIAALVVLPAARVEVEARTIDVGPLAYTLVIDPDDRLTGVVEASSAVTATGTYPVVTAATGTVVFRNWSGEPVTAPAGTLVAADQQAFETVAAVVVPAGELTSEGFIRAGEASIEVVASAPGPAANVPAGAIDTVLSQGVAGELRGFSNNPRELVLNPDPTAGGAETTGTEITQADLDAALVELRADLDDALDRLVDSDDALVVSTGATQPTITGADGLVGTRDVPEAELSATQPYDVLIVRDGSVEDAAVDRLRDDDAAVPAGYVLVGPATVEIGGAAATGEQLSVEVEVTAVALRPVDEAEVLELVRGRTVDEARDALEPVADAAEIELWPGWVTTVPEWEWRIDVAIAGASEP